MTNIVLPFIFARLYCAVLKSITYTRFMAIFQKLKEECRPEVQRGVQAGSQERDVGRRSTEWCSRTSQCNQQYDWSTGHSATRRSAQTITDPEQAYMRHRSNLDPQRIIISVPSGFLLIRTYVQRYIIFIENSSIRCYICRNDQHQTTEMPERVLHNTAP